ncbi:hypothetical protein [Spirosoma rhododendri]|uniref:Secretion system C-terminal sorting domain-containing protein n=1 Tax=Spirosoma rhododendri TaxID=2728024 RepID=A0A7L5DW42_9BACT|nr:hypothetical protein [Spirosoma rhododendri]QJD79760.1 hypothetical protein HH216_16005 [Spirosoma rhododendri]
MNTLLTTIFIKPIIALHLLLAAPVASPVDRPAEPTSFEASAYVTKAHKIRLSIDKTNQERLTINLRPVGQQSAVFTEYVRRKVTRATLVMDVDQLADGAYELELKTANGRLVKYIELRTPVEVATVQRQLKVE